MEEVYRIVVDEGEGFLEEKRSKFLSVVFAVENEEEALQRINQIRKKHWDARHHVFAYVIGERDEIVRASDDGEPSGTAGRPMLDVLLREEIHNVAVVVTRYFGGTLLGTGGLVRAYQGAVQAGLAQSRIITRDFGQKLSIQTDYTSLGKIQYILAQAGITTLDTEYTEGVTIHAMIPCNELQKIQNAIIEGTSGQANMELGDQVEYAILDGELIVF